MAGFVLPAAFIGLFSGFIGSCGSYRPLTKSYIQNITRTSSALPQNLERNTYQGCEVVPATGRKPQFEGQEYTGETCFVKIHSNEQAEVSFLGTQRLSLSLLEKNSDSFASQINNDEVLIVQVHFHRGGILSATQTDYDENDHLNYGVSGKGKFIKACIITLKPPCRY